MLQMFPRWKYALLTFTLLVGIVYALPNLYGEDPAIQISGLKGLEVDAQTVSNIKKLLEDRQLPFLSLQLDSGQILIRFGNMQHQLQAQDPIKYYLGEQYSVALNLAPVTPVWLSWFGAKPMKLGLDLRGGVRFLMEIDIESSIMRRIESDINELRSGFREEKIRFTQLSQSKDNSVVIFFDTETTRNLAKQYLAKQFPHFIVTEPDSSQVVLDMRLHPQQLRETTDLTVEQTMSTLRNRVNELGVAEAVVQRQGRNRVVVELPGIQDTARAKDILGKTATLDFLMQDDENNVRQAMEGRVPPGSRIVYDQNNQPVLLKKRVILTGNSITGATSQFDSQTGRPAVGIRLGGNALGLFKQTTLNNIGKRMAVVYRETQIKERVINGEAKKEQVTQETVISLATIQSALGNSFQITGLGLEESRDLALLLRAGAMPAAVSIVEERIIGPSMGQDNIRMGMISVGVGLGLVLIFMSFYYSVFGVIANVALLMNLILLVALMSLLEATLTMPGIAGIVLTLGMAVDANVLIFERIREELRMGTSPHASIHRGFDHAFSTIVDANLTTLIVGIILFAVGSGPVKGFAVTLSIGILTSMFTAITGTRAMVSMLYSNKKLIKRVLVGI